jgi:hypothetical protein
MAWNLESEDGQMVRTVDRPHETVLKILGLDDEDVSKAMQFPATRREILHKLQLKVIVFPDRIELNTVFPLQVIECQKCNPT